MLYYKSKELEEFMKEPNAMPRVAALARTALNHYLGDLYDPKTFNPNFELRLRSYILTTIREKVFDGIAYDWLAIDYIFRQFFEDFKVDTLPQKVLKQKARALRSKNPIYYGDELTERVMRDPKFNPRFAGLARKALSHYLGDLYNPETFDPDIEARFRFYIKGCVEDKVFKNEPYDWVWIDHFLRFVLNYEGYKHITYDDEIIDGGYNGVVHENLPVHQA